MSIEITGSGPQLDNAAIDAFEQRLGRAVPAAYREFLLRHNGGYPQPSDFVIKCRGDVPDLMGTVEQFLGIGVDDEYAEIERYLSLYRDRIPTGFFPIAQDPGSNIIVIGTDAESDGKVFFWDHEEEAENREPPTRRNLHPVADSLAELLSSFQ